MPTGRSFPRSSGRRAIPAISFAANCRRPPPLRPRPRAAEAVPARISERTSVSETLTWIVACRADAIDEEDVLRFDHGKATYAIYRTPSGYYATEGYCTHELALLAEGLVLDEVIECPLHQGRFHIPSGKALSPPVCVNLKTYPIRLENGNVLLGLPA
ncbi:MAG: Rieske 2Fe-2S domain-containing protein [Methylobacteriaceae bacterium]|nr:Rieske 2Fe-2S domain-containing protein [Methylobacteriaceae bacterium]